VFVAGDLYDGTAIDAAQAAEPLRGLRAPQGTYFVAGNHEQFGRFEVSASGHWRGVHILHNEKVEADDLQRSWACPTTTPPMTEHLRSVLQGIVWTEAARAIFVTHAPDRPHVAEEAGISCRFRVTRTSGQFFPWTWVARRIYRQFAYGLSRIGKDAGVHLQRAGTWGRRCASDRVRKLCCSILNKNPEL